MNPMTRFSCVLAFCTLASAAQASDEADIVAYMGSLQYFAHKTGLALDHDNRRLASFYAHELEEIIEALEEIEEFDGHPIARLSEKLLEPAFEEFEDSLKSDDLARASGRFDGVIKACNSCHKSAGHEFIRIERVSANPFMQSFKP